MRKLNSIPFIFGVTGHRDLRDEDIPKLKESVRSLFMQYKSNYPHTQIIVISALAEGADMLVARVAMELDVTLHVLLPYQEEQYLDSFDDATNAKAFQELKAYASRVEVNSCVDTYGHETCYQQLGERIADISNVLIALWDGTDNGKTGGTAAIVNYQRSGFEANRFDALDGNALFLITTPRESNPDVKTDFKVQTECLGKYVKGKEFEKMLGKIDTLNAEMQLDELVDDSLLKTHMVYFENTATKNQTRFKRLSKAILILTGLAFASLEIMHALHLDHFTIGYGVGLLLAFGLYWKFMKNGKVQDDFVYSRGFAEALRVQNAWNSAELNKSVARHYLKEQHHKFTWLKTTLKNLFYLDKDKVPFTPTYEKDSSVNAWVNGQIDYFKDAAHLRHVKYERLESIEKWFYRLGLGVLVLMFTIYTLESLHIVEHSAFWFNWHYLVLVSGLLLLVAAFIGEKYIKIEGYEDDIYHFNAMLSDFEEAKGALEATAKDSEAYKQIVSDLGLKALEENSKWVVLHDSMRAKPSLD